MPLYQFECEACHRVTETFMDIEKRQKYIKCEHCGGPAERLLGAPSVYIFEWNPAELNAVRDMERGEKLNNNRLYREDQDKRDINVNLTEV